MNNQEALQVADNWLPRVEEALRVDGFGSGPQIWKSGQRSGWIKAIEGGYQMHVRLFSNGIIQPEYEIHWKYLEHPNSSWSAIEAMKSVLNNYSVPYVATYTEPYTENGMIPISRTPWLGALAVALLGLVLIAGLSSQKA